MTGRLPFLRTATFTGALLWLACAAALTSAADVEIRLTASQDGQPLASSLVDFRYSPEGGLIATQWLSGMELDGRPLFPIESDKVEVPEAPQLTNRPEPALDDLDDLLGDINKAEKPAPPAPRAIDQVDPLYQDQAFSDRTRIGPVRQRRSTARRPVTSKSAISPGQAVFPPGAARVDIVCYPLTITAVRGGEPITFTPRLAFAERDLLADCLFEHSPDVPLGDDSLPARQGFEGQTGWLKGVRGGERLFRQLTIYLPASSNEPYRLQGGQFQLAATGVKLTRPNGSGGVQLRQAGPFALELVYPPEPTPLPALPVLAALRGDWQIQQTTLSQADGGQTIAPLTLRSVKHGVRTLRPRQFASTDTPTDSAAPSANGPAYVLALSQPDDDASPVLRLIGLPSSQESTAGRLTIRLTQTSDLGALDPPASFTGRLLPGDKLRGGSLATDAGPAVAITQELKFEHQGADRWSADIAQARAGLYGLTLDLEPTFTQALPIVLAHAETAGAVSLYTYHNRCDYRRGEQVHVGVQLRTVRPVAEQQAVLQAINDQGQVTASLPFTLQAEQGAPQTLFAPLETADLPLGRYRLAVKFDDPQGPALLTYNSQFTLYDDRPKSTFALYAWMSNSFSGPIKAGRKSLVNLVIGQKPSAFLTPDELAELTAQPAYPSYLQSTLAADPLYPAPHTATRYDEETEREAAIAMRLGMQYCPDYGWGMNGQEAAWNPKHTLPQELDRIRRLSAQVTQRHRDFGNFAGLHFNWYPRLGGNWEAHPPTDGNAVPRREMLQEQASQVYAATPEDQAAPDGDLRRAVRAHHFRVGAFSRAYDAWTAKARTLPAGMTERASSDDLATANALRHDQQQPGLTGAPVYTSFPPVSWFQQRNYYPTAFHASLPVAAVHAYTDYGFSPFQPLWAIDQWTAGIHDKPQWVTTMSNGRDIMLRHALLLAGRGADGIDINGQDAATAGVIADFLSAYGPYFRTQKPTSDVAIITSLRQQFSSKELIGQWMGYTGGTYFDLYVKLWFAHHPPAMLPEEDITLARLQQYKAVFLVGQQAPLPQGADAALRAYIAGGGHVFKDSGTGLDFPGQSYNLQPDAELVKANRWQPEAYNPNRDKAFVGTLASYEAIAASLQELLGRLSPPHVTADSHQVMLAVLEPSPPAAAGIGEASDSPKVVSTVFAVNDRRTMPGIVHPWNFWSATVMAGRSTLSFDGDYVLYDLLEGGREITLTKQADGRFTTEVQFNRCAGRAYLVMNEPIRRVDLVTSQATRDGPFEIVATANSAGGFPFASPLPFEIRLIDPAGETVQTLYRPLGPGYHSRVTIPAAGASGDWKVVVRELASGITAETTLFKRPYDPSEDDRPRQPASPVMLPRPAEVAQFLRGDAPEKMASQEPVLILLDERQLTGSQQDQEAGVLALAEGLRQRLAAAGRPAEVRRIGGLDLVEAPLRWRPNGRDARYQAEAVAGERVLVAKSLHSLYERGADGQAGPLDVLHPSSGWLEPGARHRIYREVILLGNVTQNRFLADLHATVGVRTDNGFLGPGAALVQVVHEAFTPHHACLSIQAPDLAGLQAGVEAAWATLSPPTSAPLARADLSGNSVPVAVSGIQKQPLPNPIQTVFGAPVQPIEFLPDGGLLVGAGTQASSYYRFDAAGKLQQHWLGKYGVLLDPRPATSPTEGQADSLAGMWIRDWWGVPGYVDTVVRADAQATPQWLMEQPRYARSYAGWKHPGSRSAVHRQSGDLLTAGNAVLSRITPEGEIVWKYDDLETSNSVETFRFARDMMIHGVSDDGRHLLIAAFGIEPYANLVSKIWRPALMLIDADNGKVLWEKPELLIDHSACGFAGPDRILAADATPGRQRLMLFDLQGKEQWSIRRPDGVSEAELTSDGLHIILRPAAPRDANRQTLGPAQGLQSVTLSPAGKVLEEREFPLTADLHDSRFLRSANRVLVSTVDGKLRCFAPDARLLWEQTFPGPCRLLPAPDGERIAVGTENGLLLLLDADGKVLRQTDLMAYNAVVDEAAYVAAYTASPAEVPRRDPRGKAPARIDVRHGEFVKFSPNLLPPAANVSRVTPAAPVELALPAGPTGTLLLALTQQTADGRPPADDARLRVEVKATGSDEVLYSAAVALSAEPAERTFAWKLVKPTALTLAIRYEGAGAGATLHQAALFSMQYPSTNLLAQRVLEGPDQPLVEAPVDLDLLLGDEQKASPPKVRFFMPNDIDLTARARGAAPFLPAVPFTMPFDGDLAGEKTSWLGKPIRGSSHAQLQLTWDTPVKLSVLAAYENPGQPYTRAFALFCRRADTGEWFQAGRRIDNESPFNLFTFPAAQVDAVTYLWLRSPDSHARLAELEGYRSVGLPGLEP
ncbi:PQQ-binding-like beta-propeller repeat protein [Lignipirellula cremea]|uniref:Uncharacterized protein n=1 Tax=Lignipirellula cremea TaxID=2528010 RepID=A0A518DPM0_9BACT|nr:PQQ-binding-like beta-propeller repeat protein [Lignipirellula cremea]QDU93779.1 hypothetical protein Pla8534_15620 [Lignipirellula cremea]